MLIWWRIRYRDLQAREFKDRDLYLDTAELDPAARAAVELCYESNEQGPGRAILQFRSLFVDRTAEVNALQRLAEKCGGWKSIFLPDYFEDENGNELAQSRLGEILTGRPGAVLLPPGAKQHDIDFILAEKPPIDVSRITLPPDALETLAYFARDLRELVTSEFFSNGPGKLVFSGGTAVIQSSVTEEEIRSFVTVYRRLYMEREPFSFKKAVAVFVAALSPHPLAVWVSGAHAEHERQLAAKSTNSFPIKGHENWTFSAKRLIDVFIYTRFAHQPSEDRSRQYDECLASVGGNKNLLAYLFLSELYHSACRIKCAGDQILQFYASYCSYHGTTPSVLQSLGVDNPAIGSSEKAAVRRERLRTEKIRELADSIWHQRGDPVGGPTQFLAEAESQLVTAGSRDYSSKRASGST